MFAQLQDALNTIWEVAPKPGRGLLGVLQDRFLSFTMVLGGERVAFHYCTDANPNAEFDDVDGADVAEAFGTWRSECADARRRVAAAPSLDVTGTGRGQEFSLRWIMVHMIEEYARHNGHADLLRERIDGTVGD